MYKSLLLPVCIVLLLSGCTSIPEGKITTIHKNGPDLDQGVSPEQQRAIMAGEQPDWSDKYPRPGTLQRKR